MRIRKGDVLTFKPLSELHRLQELERLRCGWVPSMDYLSIQQRKIIADRDISSNNPVFAFHVDQWNISTDMLIKISKEDKDENKER